MEAIDVREMEAGQIAEWEVVDHHAWGVEVALVEDPETRASVDVPFLRDLGPTDRIDGPQDYPAIGTRLRAMVRVRWPDGPLHLTARRSDVVRKR
jgi:hypothetical protein